MEQLKHECGIAVVRLKKPLDYYINKYGSAKYGLNKLYMLMEKQHNRGQEGAGLACVKQSAQPGQEFMFRERKEGKNAIEELFKTVHKQISTESDVLRAPYIGECYMGHLRYSTTGRAGLSYVHPVLRRQNYNYNTLALCGNFNLTNVNEIFDLLIKTGQHPRLTSDTTLLLEQLGHELDVEVLSRTRLANILRRCAPIWDGGFVMCGLTGNGEQFILRDPWGIRSAFFYEDDEIIVVASERPVIQTVMNVTVDDITEIKPGQGILISAEGKLRLEQIVKAKPQITPCVFERIYFSRGSDMDIYQERKKLGAAVVPQVLESIDNDLENSVVSFIPNTAEIAFYGMCQEMTNHLIAQKVEEVKQLSQPIDSDKLLSIMSRQLRIEKLAIKDIKLRTFITDNSERNELAAHVYDITYGVVNANKDNLIVIDDSIVRGTTLKQSIITILSRLQPKKLVIVSSAPQIRYPDYYGIDMSNIKDLIAFRAAIELNDDDHITEIYKKCIAQRNSESKKMFNFVQEIYNGLTDKQISNKITELVKPEFIDCEVEIIFQTIDELRASCPNHLGDWCFSGNYPTQGGLKLLNETFIKFYEQKYLTSSLIYNLCAE